MFTKKPERPSEGAAVSPKPDRSHQSADPQPKVKDGPASAAAPVRGVGNMVPSIIGEDLAVTGNIISKGEVQIEGEIQGDIHCTSLVIGDKALVTGGVVADDVIVRGRVVGSIRGLRVTLQASSHVDGDIYHQSLAIEQGAFFEGKSRRADDPTAVSAPEPAPKSSSSGKSSSSLAGSGSGTSSKSGTSSAPKSTQAAE